MALAVWGRAATRQLATDRPAGAAPAEASAEGMRTSATSAAYFDSLLAKLDGVLVQAQQLVASRGPVASASSISAARTCSSQQATSLVPSTSAPSVHVRYGQQQQQQQLPRSVGPQNQGLQKHRLKPADAWARTLTMRISRADSWEELEQLFAKRFANINSFHIASMMVRLAVLPRPMPPSPLASAGGTESMTPQPLPVGSAMRAALRSRSLDEAGVATVQMPTRYSGGMESMLLSSGAAGGLKSRQDADVLVLLRPKRRRRWLSLWAALRERAMFMAPTFSVRQAANVIHALALAGLHDPDLVAVMLSSSQDSLVGGELLPEGYTQLIIGLKRLKFLPSAQWLAQFYRGSALLMPRFNAAQLLGTAHALAGLRAVPPHFWLSALYRAARPMLPQLSHQELSTLAFAAVRLAPANSGGLGSMRPPAPWLSAFLEACELRFDAFDAPAYAIIMHSLGRLRYRPSQTWLSEYLESCVTLLEDFTPPEYSLLLRGLAFLGAHPGPGWMGVFYRVSGSKLRAFSAPQLANTGWALSLLGMRMPPLWAALYTDALRRATGGLPARGEPMSVVRPWWWGFHRRPRNLSLRHSARALLALGGAAGIGATALAAWRHHLGLPVPGEPSRGERTALRKLTQRRLKRAAKSAQSVSGEANSGMQRFPADDQGTAGGGPALLPQPVSQKLQLLPSDTKVHPHPAVRQSTKPRQRLFAELASPNGVLLSQGPDWSGDSIGTGTVMDNCKVGMSGVQHS